LNPNSEPDKPRIEEDKSSVHGESWSEKDLTEIDVQTPGSDNSMQKQTDASAESYYMLEDISKEGLKTYLRKTMIVMNEWYDVLDGKIDEEVELIEPSLELIYSYSRYVVIAAKMEKEIPILALVYLERLLERTGILMNHYNWRRLTLITLCLASKIWDDDSLENEHFPKVMKDVTLKEINTFEWVFLDLIGYDLVVRGAEYAKYFFILWSIAT